jgi:hypothetical protein
MRKLPYFKNVPLKNIFDLSNDIPFQVENPGLKEDEINELFIHNSEYECIEYESDFQEDLELSKANKWYENLSKEDKNMVHILLHNCCPTG